MHKGLIIASPSSGGGKTTFTLGLLRVLKNRHIPIQPLKTGPDYIDPAFHKAASGKESYNLDSWAMSVPMLAQHIHFAHSDDFIIAEGAMGLFDGGAPNEQGFNGSAADIARLTGWPVILVINTSSQAQSAAAIAEGFRNFDPDVRIGGFILNQIASDRHEFLVRTAFEARGLPILGVLRRNNTLELPSRHLGLVQAQEIDVLDEIIENLARFIEEHCDIDRLINLATSANFQSSKFAPPPAPAKHIAMARDQAFSFIYPHHLRAWQEQGAKLSFFSPLANEAPNFEADFLWLPGGYPELYGEELSRAENFLTSVRSFAQNKPVHGECGGYMALGQAIIDKSGTRHKMLGLLHLETSFEKRKMNLGYRRAEFTQPLYHNLSQKVTGHEFHYARIIHNHDEPLAQVFDAYGQSCPQSGSRKNHVTGSFFHLIGEGQ